MRHPLASLATLAMLIAGPAVAAPRDEAMRALEEQMAAWNRGDLESALGAYWDSPEMLWVNKGGVERGFRPFAEAMRKDHASNPAAMGRYDGTILEARDLAPDTALIVVRWSITSAGKKMGGVSTQIWRPVDGRWRAVFEHAS